MSSHRRQKCLQSLLAAMRTEEILCSLSVMPSYLGVQRQQQMRNSSSNVRVNFYLQPIFEDVILQSYQITREDSMRLWRKKTQNKSSPSGFANF